MILDKLSEIITNIANTLGYNETLRVIKSNRPDLCDYQCDEVFKLTKIYHKSSHSIEYLKLFPSNSYSSSIRFSFIINFLVFVSKSNVLGRPNT